MFATWSGGSDLIGSKTSQPVEVPYLLGTGGTTVSNYFQCINCYFYLRFQPNNRLKNNLEEQFEIIASRDGRMRTRRWLINP